jgi:opacity protein-like surface antigen
MKKIISLLGAALICVSYLNAQSPVAQGNFIFDPYIGFPQSNATRSEPVGSSNYKLNGGFLSFGGRAEYMLADKFGIGLDINYVKSGSNYDLTTVDTLYSSSTGSLDSIVTSTYNWDYTAKKTRMMVRFNYHFVQNDQIDAYVGFGAGYKAVSRIATIEDPNGSSNGLDQDKALIPIAFRIAVGTRIYFTQNIGAMVEIGLGGGGIMQFGLSAKF